nr:hypothetical protein [Tanacetum cinerariifolium]
MFPLDNTNYVSQTQMGGSSSQLHTQEPMSPIHSFPTEDMYEHQYSDSFQHTSREDSPVEFTAPPPKSKPIRGRQKKMDQNDDAPRSTAWTYEEEITLGKGWVHVSKNSVVGNARRAFGFWTQVLRYQENKTKAPGRRTYDMVNEKWKSCARTWLGLGSELPRPMGKDKAKGLKKKWSRSSGSSSSTNDEALVGLMASKMAVHDERAMETKKQRTLSLFEDQMRDMEYSFQHTAREDFPVEVAAPPPKSKPTRGRHKRTAQNKDASWSTACTNEEEIALCKGCVHVSENSVVGNARWESRFWTEVLRYVENKTKAPDLRTYDMVNKKWKTVRPNVDRYCGVYAIMRRAQLSGAVDEDYYAMALLDYEVEHGMTFTLPSKRHNTFGSNSFNTEYENTCINLNVDVGDDEEDEVQELRRPMGWDKAKCLKKKGRDHRYCHQV